MTTTTNEKAQNIANETAKNTQFKDWKGLRDALKQDPAFTSEFNGDSNALRSVCRAALSAAKPAAAEGEKPAKAKKGGKKAEKKAAKKDDAEPTLRGMTVAAVAGNEKFKGLDRLLFQIDKGEPATPGALARGLDLSNTFVNKTVGRHDSRGQQDGFVVQDGKTGLLSITEKGRTFYTSPKPAKAKKGGKLTELKAPAKTVKGASRPKKTK